MPAEKNTLLRVLVPFIVLGLGLGVAFAIYLGSSRPSSQPPANIATPGAAQPDEQGASAQSAAAQPPVQQSADPEPARPTTQTEARPAPAELAPAPAGATGLRARVQPAAAPGATIAPLGDLAAPYRALITFTLQGAGVESITMAEFYETVERQARFQVQKREVITDADGNRTALTSLAAREIEINGEGIDLYGTIASPVWRETGPGGFEAEIIDSAGAPVLRIERRYSLAPGSFELQVAQRVENLSGAPVQFIWRQYGPIQLKEDATGYGLDMRRVRLGYSLEPRRDPSQQIIEADRVWDARSTVVDRVLAGEVELWPRPGVYKGAGELSWLAQTSRYFVFAVYPLLDAQAAAANLASPVASPLEKRLGCASAIHAVALRTQGPDLAHLLLQLTSPPVKVEPGAAASLDFAAFAGPLGRRQLSASASPVFGALALDELVLYNIGGMCWWCSWQWLARILLAFLTLLHDYVVFDWALAIMVLVVCVRTILHPLTKKSQISMTRFGRKMQGLAPKQAKIREKYGNDSKKMQQELMRLMKEEGVSYTQALGCLPVFLQTPIWAALYAMLYFSFDLRHAGAFFGVFQSISGGNWLFMADLSAADHFIGFGRSVVSIPLLGHVTGINILPVLLGIVFFIQQKYLTPPSTVAMTPEQEMQQKMMKWMMVVMFPLMMYNAPCGLSLYFITNSTLGILESRYIRSHIDKLDKSGQGGMPPKPETQPQRRGER